MCAIHAHKPRGGRNNRPNHKVRTLLVAIFGVRFIMVGMEVVVPLVTSRTRNAAAKSEAGSADKV